MGEGGGRCGASSRYGEADFSSMMRGGAVVFFLLSLGFFFFLACLGAGSFINEMHYYCFCYNHRKKRGEEFGFLDLYVDEERFGERRRTGGGGDFNVYI